MKLFASKEDTMCGCKIDVFKPEYIRGEGVENSNSHGRRINAG